MKFHKNKRKHARRVEQLQAQGGFRAPERLNWQNRRILQATHEGQVREVAGFNGTRVVDTTGAEFEVSTVEPVPRDALSVRLPPRLQRPGKQTKPDKRAILQPWADSGRTMLSLRVNQEAPVPVFGTHLRAQVFPVQALGPVGLGPAMN